MKRAFCVIGDLVLSRQITARRAFQTRLNQGLQDLSRARRDIVSPYTITLGDEFQAVYASPKRIFRDLLAVQSLAHPTRVRFAIGVGSLTTRLNRERAIGMDGPAFSSARDSLIKLKNGVNLYRVGGLPQNTETWVNLDLDLISHIVTPWKKNRFDIAVRLLDAQSPLDIGPQLHVTASAVYKNIRAGALPAVTGMLTFLGNILDEKNRGTA